MVGKRQIYVPDLCALSNIFKIHDIYVLEICKFMFRFNYNLLPNVFLKYFSKHNSIYCYTPGIFLKVIIFYQESKRQFVKVHCNIEVLNIGMNCQI